MGLINLEFSRFADMTKKLDFVDEEVTFLALKRASGFFQSEQHAVDKVDVFLN